MGEFLFLNFCILNNSICHLIQPGTGTTAGYTFVHPFTLQYTYGSEIYSISVRIRRPKDKTTPRI